MKKSIYLIITFIFIIAAILINWQLVSTIRQMDDVSVKYSLSGDKNEKHYVLIVQNEYSLDWTQLVSGAKDSASEHGVLLEILDMENFTEDSQKEFAEVAIASKVDGIILDCNDTGSYDAIIDQAESEQIPVVVLYRDRETTKRSINVNNNYDKEGLLAALAFEQAFSQGTILLLQSNDNKQSSSQRKNSFLDYYKSKMVSVQILTFDLQSATETKRQLESIMTRAEIEGIFATSEDLTVFAAETIERLELNVMLIGIGNTFNVKNYIRTDIIDEAFANNHYLIGKTSVDLLYKEFKGVIYVDPTILNKENIDSTDD